MSLYYPRPKQGRPTLVLCDQTGREFSSIEKAADEMKIPGPTIRFCLNRPGHICRHGFSFQRIGNSGHRPPVKGIRRAHISDPYLAGYTAQQRGTAREDNPIIEKCLAPHDWDTERELWWMGWDDAGRMNELKRRKVG